MKWRRDQTVVIGCGNELRGDDGVGPYVARRLRRLGVAAIAAHQLTPELSARLATAHRAIFIDAAADLNAGEIALSRVRPALGGPFEHHCGPGALLGLTQQAFRRSPAALAVAIGAKSFDLGRPLSRPVRRAGASVAAMIAGRLLPG
jgi:hydrogenase maturation protease